MANENRNNDSNRSPNRSNEPIEPNRGSGEENRSGKTGAHPGGYGPSQGPAGEGRNVEREPSGGVEREH
jgi:hypothetical protein